VLLRFKLRGAEESSVGVHVLQDIRVLDLGLKVNTVETVQVISCNGSKSNYCGPTFDVTTSFKKDASRE